MLLFGKFFFYFPRQSSRQIWFYVPKKYHVLIYCSHSRDFFLYQFVFVHFWELWNMIFFVEMYYFERNWIIVTQILNSSQYFCCWVFGCFFRRIIMIFCYTKIVSINYNYVFVIPSQNERCCFIHYYWCKYIAYIHWTKHTNKNNYFYYFIFYTRIMQYLFLWNGFFKLMTLCVNLIGKSFLDGMILFYFTLETSTQ